MTGRAARLRGAAAALLTPPPSLGPGPMAAGHGLLRRAAAGLLGMRLPPAARAPRSAAHTTPAAHGPAAAPPRAGGPPGPLRTRARRLQLAALCGSLIAGWAELAATVDPETWAADTEAADAALNTWARLENTAVLLLDPLIVGDTLELRYTLEIGRLQVQPGRARSQAERLRSAAADARETVERIRRTLRDAADDLRGADLRHEPLAGADLTGVRWNAETRWPSDDDEQRMRRASEEDPPGSGVFVVRPTGAENPFPVA